MIVFVIFGIHQHFVFNPYCFNLLGLNYVSSSATKYVVMMVIIAASSLSCDILSNREVMIIYLS